MNIESTKTKVLIVITKSNWGGAQKYVYDLATNLNKDRIDVEVIFGGKGPLAIKLQEAGIKTISIEELGRDVSILKDFKVFFKLLKIFKEKRPDVVQLNSTKIGGIGAVAGRLAGVKKVIFTAHGWAFNENRSFISKCVIKLLYWVMMILSHKIVAVSNGMMRYVKHWPLIQKKIIVIYNGLAPIDFAERNTSRNVIIEKQPTLSSFKENMWIGTIAELHPIKNIDVAIRAMADIKKIDSNIKYVVISDGEKKEELKSLISELELSDTVFLTGAILDAAKYLKAFDLFMLVSKSEGLPYVVLEAGLANLPVVVTNVGGISEIVKDMESGVKIRPNDPKEITSAIQYYLEHPKEKEEFASALHQKVSTQFSIETMIKNTENLYI